MNALANPEVGQFLNEHFVSAFQKVGTFRIVNGQKQGGNVASYFCAQDGLVLHAVAGPVNAKTLLKEAKWVVETARHALKETEEQGTSFKAQLRRAHAERLRSEHGLVVSPVTFDAPVANEKSALSYRDPNGKPLAPKLSPVPIDGPDVSFTSMERAAFDAQQKSLKAAKKYLISCRRGGRVAVSNQGRVHMLLAAHSMKKIELLYGSIFEGILGERVSSRPVIIKSPFPWMAVRKSSE